MPRKWVSASAMTAIGVAIIAFGVVGYWLFPISLEVSESHPEIAFMRAPVLALGETSVGIVVTLLVMAEFALASAARFGGSAKNGPKTLRTMGALAFAGALVGIAIAGYTESVVPGSITNLYVGLYIIVLTAIGAALVFVGRRVRGRATAAQQ